MNIIKNGNIWVLLDLPNNAVHKKYLILEMKDIGNILLLGLEWEHVDLLFYAGLLHKKGFYGSDDEYKNGLISVHGGGLWRNTEDKIILNGSSSRYHYTDPKIMKELFPGTADISDEISKTYLKFGDNSQHEKCNFIIGFDNIVNQIKSNIEDHPGAHRETWDIYLNDDNKLDDVKFD